MTKTTIKISRSGAPGQLTTAPLPGSAQMEREAGGIAATKAGGHMWGGKPESSKIGPRQVKRLAEKDLHQSRVARALAAHFRTVSRVPAAKWN